MRATERPVHSVLYTQGYRPGAPGWSLLILLLAITLEMFKRVVFFPQTAGGERKSGGTDSTGKLFCRVPMG